jgi:hypothetical protein
MSSDSGEVDELLQQMISGEAAERREATQRLSSILMRRRTTLATRGSATHPAENAALTDAANTILARAVSDEDPRVRVEASGLAGQAGDRRTIPALMERLRDENRDVRIAVCSALADIGGAETIEALAEVAGRDDEDSDVRLAALSSLEELVTRHITSGPDRWFGEDESADLLRQGEEVAVLSRVYEMALGALERVMSTDEESPLIKVKAAEIATYMRCALGEGPSRRSP